MALGTGASLSHESEDVLIFEVGTQRFGLAAEIVQEIVRAVTIVALPRAMAGVEGVVNFRGQVVPVLNLRQRLGLPVKAVDLSDHLVFTRFQGSLLALRVDRVVDLLRLTTTSLVDGKADSGTGHGLDRVADLGGRLVPIVDMHGMFAAGEREAMRHILQGVMSPAEPGSRS